MDKIKFGKEVQNARKYLGLSVEQTARILDTTVQEVEAVEAGLAEFEDWPVENLPRRDI